MNDTYHVCLYGPDYGAERVIDSYSGGLDARDEALRKAEYLSELREHMLALGVQMRQQAYEIRVQQVRRIVGGGSRRRWLTIADEPGDSFWSDDPGESVQRTIAAGAERVRRAELDSGPESPAARDAADAAGSFGSVPF